LLKLSGEVLAGEGGESLGAQRLGFVAQQVAEAAAVGAQIAIVVGGGNIVRGAAFAAHQAAWRVKADQMGMLATAINAMALRLQLESIDVPATVLSAWPLGPMCEPYTAERCAAALDAGSVVVLAGGTGNPFFTTDTAAALRAVEIGASALLKATNVDGIYDADPKANPDARRYDELSYRDALEQALRVMDQTAFALCREQALPIVVFDLLEPGNVARAVAGQSIGTIVREA